MGRVTRTARDGRQWGPCTRCGHTWVSYRTRLVRPKGWRPPNCPKCHSAYWASPKVNQTAQIKAEMALRERAMSALPPPPVGR